jgi:hypothetical protein
MQSTSYQKKYFILRPYFVQNKCPSYKKLVPPKIAAAPSRRAPPKFWKLRYSNCSKWKFRSAGILFTSETNIYCQKNEKKKDMDMAYIDKLFYVHT